DRASGLAGEPPAGPEWVERRTEASVDLGFEVSRRDAESQSRKGSDGHGLVPRSSAVGSAGQNVKAELATVASPCLMLISVSHALARAVGAAP
ncbi:MAG: hypothetical protein RBU37_08225, partial [Myxococcota bacterium]|nr:hypothetical protein [Myxococcota bacterium]